MAGFGARGRPEPLPGGAGTSWRVGELVLKPLDTSVEELAWQEQLLRPLEGRADVRVAAPLRAHHSARDSAHHGAHDGALVVDGWTARRHLEGEPATARSDPGRWAEVAEGGRRFHAAVAGEPRPGHLDARTDPWAAGDRVAWDLAGDGTAGDRSVADGAAPLPAAVRELAALRRPVARAAQVVHGDLTGNVLVHPGLPPAVIDLSPYWRPAAWATAVVVVDALVWHRAGAEVAVDLLPEPDAGQLLLRALLYRAVTDAVAGPRLGAPGEWRRAVEVVAAALHP